MPQSGGHARQAPLNLNGDAMRPTLLFDLDGTLADTAADLCETLNVILELHGRERVSEARVRHLVGGGARLLLERGFRETGEEASEELLDQTLAEYLDYYERHIADHTKLWPGMRDQLDRLADAGALMAVCTNKVEGLSRKLIETLGIDHYFPVVIGGDTLPLKKPDPEHLLEAIRQLGGNKAHAVMVGDSEADIYAAKNAGIPSICVTFGYTRIPVAELGADVTIDHYDEFPAALAKLLPTHFG
ncbi:MAG: HAD family hydrolase [Parvibaculum sp.]